jgi:hypothetical protein
MSALEVIAVVAIVVYVIARQLIGESLRGKRVVVLPAVLVVVGAVDLTRHGHHPGGSDIVMIVIGAVVAAGIGVAQGRMMRLERRDGVLWGQMPPRSLWLWLVFVASRVGLDLVASGLGAHVAASTEPILLTLGINRLAQAAVIAPRAWAAGIPFAPERDGSTFLAGVFGQSPPDTRRSRRVEPSRAGTEMAGPGRTGTGQGWPTSVGVIAEQVARSRARDRRRSRRRR